MSEESSAKGIEVFISFAYGDQASIRNREVWKRLTECLDALRVEGVVSAWSCRAIDTSANDTASFESMKRSHVIIFALGKDYLDHPERYRHVLRDLPESGRYLVFAMLLFSGSWYDSPFRIFNPLPSTNTPVAESSDIESAFIEFKEAIKEARQAIYPDRKSRRFTPALWSRMSHSRISRILLGKRLEKRLEKSRRELSFCNLRQTLRTSRLSSRSLPRPSSP